MVFSRSFVLYHSFFFPFFLKNLTGCLLRVGHLMESKLKLKIRMLRLEWMDGVRFTHPVVKYT